MEAKEETLEVVPRAKNSSSLSLFSCGFLNWFSSAKVESLSSPGDSSKGDLKSITASMPKTENELLSASNLRKFTFSDLRTATRNFRPDSIVGEGGFGYVFKGWIDEHGNAPVKPGTGLGVAVKIMNPDGNQGHKEWLTEVGYLGEHHHPNLVKLIGYCIEGSQRVLVYEYMQKGSLENHLFRGASPLSWITRVKILWGAAVGLSFLHSRDRPIIYRDFKASNVLLDPDYNAKLSDFGLAKDGPEGDETHVSTRVMGTFGYAAPEYVMTGHLTARSDTYSFGVVLLEVITGRRSVDKNRPRGEQNLVEWARPFMHDKRLVTRIVDPRLKEGYSLAGVLKASSLAARCLSRDPKARPTMEEVEKTLGQIVRLKDSAGSSKVVSAPPRDAVVRGSYRRMWMVQA